MNLIPDYKILHDAGYNALAYALRNFGHSGAANGGIASSGIFEARTSPARWPTRAAAATRET